MSILDIFKSADINEGVKEFRADKSAVLLDVRSKEEYASGHIPGSINIPLARLFINGLEHAGGYDGSFIDRM